MPATDISPWLEFGWPVALLVLVLTGVGAGIGWLFREWNKRQAKEEEGRKEEREQRERILSEQHSFIKSLAENSIANLERAIAGQEKTAVALEEITKSLSVISENCQSKLVENGRQLERLEEAQCRIEQNIRDLHKDVIKVVAGGIGDDGRG